MHQLRDRALEGFGESAQHIHGQILRSPFDKPDIVSVTVDVFRQFFLRKAQAFPACPDRPPEFYAVGFFSHGKKYSIVLHILLHSAIVHHMEGAAMKVFLYARKSTDDEERQILSIDAQRNELREYAAKQGLEIVFEFVESMTAKEPGRPIFNDMLRRVESGEADALLAWHPDRLARNSVDGGKIIWLVDTGKLTALKFPAFWFENTPQGKFVLNMAFGQSKYYVDALSENVRRGMREKIRRGV